jgi:glycosyltransferase involved in cell wall biosynthesis
MQLGRRYLRYEPIVSEERHKNAPRLRPKIALVETSSGMAGTAKCVCQFVRAADPNQFELFLFARRKIGWYESVEAVLPDHVYYYGDFERSAAFGTGPLQGYIQVLASLALNIPMVFYFLKRFRQLGIQLVHTNNNIIYHIPAFVAARILQIPIICHIHDHIAPTLVEKLAARMVNHFVVLTKSSKELYQAHLKRTEIAVIHNGLVLNEYLRKPITESDNYNGELKIGVVGRLVPWKGQDLLIKAAPSILAAHPHAKIYIIGSNPSDDSSFENKLRSLAKTLGCEASVIFTGWIKDPRALISQLDVLVCPSIAPEPFGLVILEAMASGTAVVASRQGGPLDIISDGEDGFLFEPNNLEELQSTILKLLADPGLRARVAACALSTVEKRFTVETQMLQLYTLYRQLLSDARHPLGDHDRNSSC